MADQPTATEASANRIRAVVEGNRLELIESGVARLKELLSIMESTREQVAKKR